jgi:syntenin-1
MGTINILVYYFSGSNFQFFRLLTDHQLLEVNGQNVIGLNDKDITNLFRNSGSVVTLTIMPVVLYDHMIKK